VATSLDDLIRSADLDGLVRHVDDTCASREWDHLVRIRNEARSAVNTGRQLWPIATLANYRLALWAPAEFAVRALDDTARTFMPGPVSEILAVHHRWEQLEPFLEHGHDRSLIAYERSLRGDEVDITENPLLDIPIAISDWEPRYELANYDDDGVIQTHPSITRRWHSCAVRAADALEDDTNSAFSRMMEHWTSQSEGVAKSVVVEGEIEEAFSVLGLRYPDFAQITSGDALRWLTWAASSGGAHGKRRGVATGRSEAWWLLATFTGLEDRWPCRPTDLGEVLQKLEYFAFRAPSHPDSGWSLQLAIVDPYEGLTVALSATDHA
jgi:hypothetical protein